MPVPFQDELERLMRAPGGLEAGWREIPQIAQRIEMMAAAEASVGEAEGIVALFAAIGEFIAGISLWMVLLGIIALVIGLRIVEFVFYKVCDAIPWGLGAGPHALVHAVFSPLDNAEGWVAGELWSAAKYVLHAMEKFANTLVDVFMGPAISSSHGPSTAALRHLQAEYADLARKVNHVEGQIAYINSHLPPGVVGVPVPAPSPSPHPGGTGGTVVITTPIPTSLTQRITRLENHQVTIYHNLNVLHSDVNVMSHNQDVFNEKLTRLQENYLKVRNTQYSVQDTLDNVDSQLKRVEHELGILSPQVDASTRQLFLMQPLEQLLYLGQPGVNVLKKLEQDPCQCLRYRQVPSDTSEELAVYEFLTNG